MDWIEMREQEAGVTSGRFWCLQDFRLADVLSPAEQEEMHVFMRDRDYKAGETIYFPGDPSDTIYAVRHGHVRLTYLDESGKRLTFAIIGRGQLFGETALAGEETRHWLAEAMDDATVCTIGRDDFLNFAADKPKLALRISTYVGERLTEIQSKLEDLLFKDVNERLSQTLLKLSEQYGDRDAEGVRIKFKMTHQELANLIGATRETTSLALGEFEKRGLLSKERGVITLKDIDGLKNPKSR